LRGVNRERQDEEWAGQEQVKKLTSVHDKYRK
jgi:hypothetical protein